MVTKITTEIHIENNYYLSSKNNNNAIDLAGIDTIPLSEWFDTWLNALDDSLPQANGYELSLRFTSDREIATFNNQYRQKNQPTDVLAFAALESEVVSPLELTEFLYLGDIVISLDTAYRQAKEQHHSPVTEIAWLASHGLLHLLGWDHPDDYSLKKMWQKQAILLKLVEITD
ncbi:Endoribonuclease YbeY [Hyella patelloides LEGE 07179]|uniref:Endoribonuclease YbeY n=1 Tax=Hyella patelloides LEGE 07179 TaxID=945734 RepID=A0A563VM73_9CYAN|nr:rRNA maturation RNase YbeY [Hyella patelloides]VEP12433.1 Endoribonuclease YbeY [Hyella patelloides LEGE 07179]